ncbi:MAG: YigZ family protein [Coriobacteriaceae bacterium]|nr:YigZ family protein [Coriobacteriaceae bacterium]
MESYRTIRPGVEALGEYVDRKSRFIGQLVHVESEREADAHLAAMRARHYDARHNVPAWILADGTERASDDGEPQRTSGMPSLEVLRGANLRDVCVVTTRYFGGTLLGPGGLVRAYTAAVQEAVAAAESAGWIFEMTSVQPVDVVLPYALFEQGSRMVGEAGGKIASSDFTAEVCVHAVFRAGEQEPFLARLRELMCGQEQVSVGAPRFAEF